MEQGYHVQVYGDMKSVAQSVLRPRRDDYQQHESRASSEDLALLKEGQVPCPDLTEATLEWVVEEIVDAEAAGTKLRLFP
jgi:hypothetical protein